MKKHIKRIFLSIALLSGLDFTIITCNATTQTMPISSREAKSMPSQGLPSVADVFGNMSEDEIIKQVQEAQKFFESLSPEEMAELEKMVAQTLDSMTPEDIEDIQGIAKMVEPHIELPKEDIKNDSKSIDSKNDVSKQDKKTENIDTNDIKKMISNITSQIDSIFQKAESSKEAIEEIKNKWSSKITFDNMKRQIGALKEDRLLKKLSKAENKEDKDLVDKLKEFHKDLTKYHDTYKIEDTFGVPTSRTIEAKNLKKTQEVLTMFENHIDEVMPPMEKFLRKHDPEALEMAKEASERFNKAIIHEKDSELRRASTPSSHPMQGYPSTGTPYPSRGENYNSYGYPSSYDTYDYYPTTGQQTQPGQFPKSSHDMPGTSSNIPTTSQSPTDKKNENKKNTKDEQKNTPFDSIIDLLESHKDEYDDKYTEKFKHFLTKELTTYPQLPEKSSEHDDWLHSIGSHQNKGLQKYIDKTLQNLKKYDEELGDLKNKLENIYNKIANLSPEEASKLIEHSAFKHMQHRIEKYTEHFEKAAKQIEDTFAKNSTDLTTDAYKNIHAAFISKITQQLIDPLANLMTKIDRIKKKAKRNRYSKAGQHAQQEALKI